MNSKFRAWAKKVNDDTDPFPKDYVTVESRRNVFEKLPKDSPSNPAVFCLEHPENYGTPSEMKLINISKLDNKITWNGKVETFDVFKNLFHGNMTQVGADYCVQKEFLASYISRGNKVLDKFSLLDLTQKQLNSD